MKVKHLIIVLAVLYLAAGNMPLLAQDDAAQKAMAEYMAPGKMHELLSKNAGEWKTSMKLWMAPGQPPIVSEGTAVSEMILGGRYLQTKHTGNVMGMPMMGLGIDAFDNGKKIFVSTWYDNMGTGVMVLTGTYNEKAKMMTLQGVSYDPVSGKDVKIKETLKYVSDTHQIMEMYTITDAGEIKSMEVDMTKIK